MVAGFHLIWTAYGWWLPNDPRGSSSLSIRVEKIAELGELHHGRKRVQPPREELQQFQEQARDRLTHPYLEFPEDERAIIANAFTGVIQAEKYTCYACAIMPEHVHLCLRKHRDFGESMIEKLQAKSKSALIEASKRSKVHPAWGGPGWKVFLNTQDDFRRIIRYIEGNPAKSGLPAQRWPFVVEYDGWLPLGKGERKK